MSGERKFGYGVDVLRAWVATKDTDKNIIVVKDQLEDINKEVKLFRNVIRSLLGFLHDYDINKKTVDFNKLTLVDKMMMVKLLEYTKQVTEAYERYDLKYVYNITQNFII